MKKENLKTVSILILVLFMTSAIFAQNPGRNPNGMKANPPIPNLTDTQKTEIQNLRTAMQKDVLPLRNELGEKEARLRTLSTADKADMAAINKQLEDISAIKLEIAKKNAAFRQDIRKLLDDDQRAAFDMNAGKRKAGKASKRPAAPCK